MSNNRTTSTSLNRHTVEFTNKNNKPFSNNNNNNNNNINIDASIGGNDVALINEQGEKEQFFWSKQNSQWTVKDQKRLVSVDELFSRTLEFHNNIHSFRSWDAYDIIENDEIEDDEWDDIALEIIYFDEENFQKMLFVKFHEVVKTLIELKKYSEIGLLWIHIKDLSVLPLIIREDELNYLHMHRICLTGFYDLRAHSTILPTCDGSFLLSVCGYRIDKLKDCVKMYKTFIYNHQVPFECTHHDNNDNNDSKNNNKNIKNDNNEICNHRKVLFTYEQELMPDIDTDIKAAAENKINNNNNNNKTKELIKKEKQNIKQQQTSFNPLNTTWGPNGTMFIQNDPNDLNIIANVQQRIPSMNVKHLLTLGTMLLIYEIATEALLAQDEIIEYFSRTLNYFKQKVHIHLQHEEKIIIHRKMHIIMSALSIMSSNISESALCFMRLLDPPPSLKRMVKHTNSVYGNSNIRGSSQFSKQNFNDIPMTSSGLAIENGGGSHLNFPMMPSTGLQLDDDHLPYIYHLMDAYDFAKQCIGNSIEAVKSLHQTMDAVAQLRTDHTATTLSLIATVFLPLTFLAGVFGMNFTVNGGYTMGLLNQTYGPVAFYGMCVITFLVCFIYFARMGWISPINLPTNLRNCFSCFIPQNSIFSDSSHYEKRENTVNNSRIESVNEMMRTSEVFQFNSNMPDPDLMAALEEKKRSEIAHTKRSLMSMQQRDRISAFNDPTKLKTPTERRNSEYLNKLNQSASTNNI